MGSWDINTQQVSQVLTDTTGHLGEEGSSDGLLGNMQEISTTVETINEMAASLPIGIALGEFCEHYFGVMGDMVSKTVSGLEGASEATTAYINGDLEMASEAQSTAGDIPVRRPPGAIDGPV